MTDDLRMVKLGRRGPLVSRFCLGLLPLSRLQSNLPHSEAVSLVESALEAGVTFFDTAELYETYRLVRAVLRPPAVVATKSYAYTRDGMRRSLERALSETGREHIDIFLLHEQESRLTLAGHQEALRCLVEARRAGVVGAVGVSTHAPEVVAAAAEMEEIDVIHPLVNYRGLGLLGGTLQEMLAAIEKAGRAGKGIYAMKILGGGHLAGRGPGWAGNPEEAFAFVRDLEHVHAVAVGVKSREELLYDLALLRGERPSDDLARAVAGKPRSLFIEEHCEGCGECVTACRYKALELVVVDGAGLAEPPPPGKGLLRVRVDMEKCVLCGYCAAACRDFYIKVV